MSRHSRFTTVLDGFTLNPTIIFDTKYDGTRNNVNVLSNSCYKSVLNHFVSCYYESLRLAEHDVVKIKMSQFIFIKDIQKFLM